MAKEDIENLIEEAKLSLGSADYLRAEQIGKRLLELQVRDGYDILATAYGADEKIDQAIAILEQSLEKYPNDWRFWMRLGNYQSDHGAYEEASTSYLKALSCPDAFIELINLNRAILLGRRGKKEEALRLLKNIHHRALSYEICLVKLDLLNQLGLYGEVLAEALEPLYAIGTQGHQADWAEICFQLAYAQWNLDKNEFKTKEFLRESLYWDRTYSDALWLLRELNHSYSEKAHLYILQVHGYWLSPYDREQSPAAFATKYHVVADSPEEALDIIRSFEVEDINKDSLFVTEYQQEDAEGHSKGVYMVFPIYTFHEDKED